MKKGFAVLLVISLALSLAVHIAEASGYELAYIPVLDEYADFVSTLEREGYNDYYDYMDITCDMDEPWTFFLESDYVSDLRNNLGYALADVNGDGVPELFLLSRQDTPSGDYLVHAIYTLADARPNLLAYFWSRYRCSVCVDGRLYIEGSSGAEDSTNEICQITQDGKRLVVIETIGIESYDANSFESLDEPRYYKIDQNGVKTILTEEEAEVAYQNMQNACSSRYSMPFVSIGSYMQSQDAY